MTSFIFRLLMISAVASCKFRGPERLASSRISSNETDPVIRAHEMSDSDDPLGAAWHHEATEFSAQAALKLFEIDSIASAYRPTEGRAISLKLSPTDDDDALRVAEKSVALEIKNAKSDAIAAQLAEQREQRLQAASAKVSRIIPSLRIRYELLLREHKPNMEALLIKSDLLQSELDSVIQELHTTQEQLQILRQDVAQKDGTSPGLAITLAAQIKAAEALVAALTEHARESIRTRMSQIKREMDSELERFDKERSKQVLAFTEGIDYEWREMNCALTYQFSISEFRNRSMWWHKKTSEYEFEYNAAKSREAFAAFKRSEDTPELNAAYAKNPDAVGLYLTFRNEEDKVKGWERKDVLRSEFAHFETETNRAFVEDLADALWLGSTRVSHPSPDEPVLPGMILEIPPVSGAEVTARLNSTRWQSLEPRATTAMERTCGELRDWAEGRGKDVVQKSNAHTYDRLWFGFEGYYQWVTLETKRCDCLTIQSDWNQVNYFWQWR